MILRMYAVLDKAVKAFNPPICFRSEGEALRSFADAVDHQNGPIGKYKSDYCFCYIGLYDDSTGLIESVPFVVVAEAATIGSEALAGTRQ